MQYTKIETEFDSKEGACTEYKEKIISQIEDLYDNLKNEIISH